MFSPFEEVGKIKKLNKQVELKHTSLNLTKLCVTHSAYFGELYATTELHSF